jgi:hypothetical protein
MASPTPLSVNARLPVKAARSDDASHAAGKKSPRAAKHETGSKKVAKAPTSSGGFRLRWWMAAVAVVIAGAIAAIVVGMSGPKL